MSFGDYLQGSIELIMVAAAMGFAAVALRGRLLPGWSGASARLAEVVLGLSLLVVTLELVGVVGLYRPGWVLAASLIVGVGIGRRLRVPRRGVPLPSPAVGPFAMAFAVAAALLVAAHWAMPTQTGLDIGMYLPNTTWHNAPFAARFVQDHQVGALHFTEVLNLTVWFYPQNSELLHSAGVLFLGNDFLSPLINIGWMSLCLLAAWSFARPYGAGPIAVLAIALVLDANMLLLYQPGDAKNDTAGLFFLLAAAAILVNADAQRRATSKAEAGTAQRTELPLASGALFVAALAAGLALGTKLNLLAPFGLLTLGVIWVAGRGMRLRTTGIWVAGSLITGGFWFARNLVEAGNPLPWIDKGPLPGPDQLDIEIREGHTVSDYLTNWDVIKDSFIPGLHESFGDLWPLVLVAVVGGFLLAIFRGRTPVIRMLGVVALLSGFAYLFTPLTAAGPLDHPSAFTTNLRYASPAIGLGAMLLAVDPGLTRPRVQNWVLGSLVFLLLVQAVPFWDLGEEWEKDFVLGAIDLSFFLILVPVGLALLGQRGWDPWPLGLGVVAALMTVVAIGWSYSESYVEDRYQASTAPSDFPEGMRGALAWFNREDPHDARIAVVGGRPGFKQYVFYGDDLSNHVQYVARHEPHGAYIPIASEDVQKQPLNPAATAQCQEWIRDLNEGDYDYAIIGPDQRTQSTSPVEALWSAVAGGQLLEQRENVFVMRLNGDLDPAACPLGELQSQSRPEVSAAGAGAGVSAAPAK
jgi:hypothetical protein